MLRKKERINNKQQQQQQQQNVRTGAKLEGVHQAVTFVGIKPRPI